MHPSTNAIADEITRLKEEREMRLISDDYAMTNGTIRRIDERLAEIIDPDSPHSTSLSPVGRMAAAMRGR